jgi:hypothetical protein
MGNIRSRAEHFEQLGSGQHIVADNVFEGRTCYNNRPGGYIVRATDGATQVIVRNNLFVNYNSCGIEVIPGGDERSLPTSNCTITGNIMDMTAIGEPSRRRIAIHVGASDAIVSDNQIYTRGVIERNADTPVRDGAMPKDSADRSVRVTPVCDTNLTAIRLTEPAINLIVHDNLVRNCGTGIVSDTAYSYVGEIVDPTTFKAGRGIIPMERRLSHRYRGWNVAWFRGTKPDGFSVVESFDPETFHFKLKQPHAMKVGDKFEVFAPSANWNLHDNTLTGCAQPVAFTGHGSDTSFFRNNLIERGGETNAIRAIIVTGKFKLIGNHITGLDEKEVPAKSAR